MGNFASFNLSPFSGDNINDVEKKFIKLKTIYLEVLNKVGWDKYAIINLKFDNQVVCTKKIKKNI